MLHAIIGYFENNDNALLKTGKVAVYSHVAQELSKYSTRPNPWSWRYVHGLATGKLKESKYIKEAIVKLSDEIAGIPAMIPVPVCPIPGCTEAYIHLHGAATYDPTAKTVAKIRKPYTRTPRNYPGKIWLY